METKSRFNIEHYIAHFVLIRNLKRGLEYIKGFIVIYKT